MPIRIFTPQVLANTGAKLSKSLLREQGKGSLPADVEPWMLDTTAWPGSVHDYVDALVWLVGELLTDPKHFFRSFTVKELARLMTARPADLHTRPRAHEMGIYKRYFDLESVTSVNPTATREDQLVNICQIYPPEREALGVVAIGIELVDPPR